jgi:hypothetical protein
LIKGEETNRTDTSKGLTARLDERRHISWDINPSSGNAVPSLPRTGEREIEVCAQCHARRGQIAEGYEAGKPFLDYYRPALLTEPLYYADGQQRDEVYNWGSFLQSKMYASGVMCSDSETHHHHKIGSAGAACVACHMPTTTYMVIDPRHDHSLRVPRPDLSIKLGTPNPCKSNSGTATIRRATSALLPHFSRPTPVRSTDRRNWPQSPATPANRRLLAPQHWLKSVRLSPSLRACAIRIPWSGSGLCNRLLTRRQIAAFRWRHRFSPTRCERCVSRR